MTDESRQACATWYRMQSSSARTCEAAWQAAWDLAIERAAKLADEWKILIIHSDGCRHEQAMTDLGDAIRARGRSTVPKNVQPTNDIPYGDGYGSGE